MAPPYTEKQREQIERALVAAAPVALAFALSRVRKGREAPNPRTEKGRALAEEQKDRALELFQEASVRVLNRDRVFEWEGEIDQERFQGFLCFTIKSIDDRRPDQKRPHHEFDDEADAPATSKTSEDLLARKRAIERLREEVKDDLKVAELLEIVIEGDCSMEEKARRLGTDVDGVYELNRRLDRAAKRLSVEMSS